MPAALRSEARREMDGAARQRAADGAEAGARSTARLASRSRDLLRQALRNEEAGRVEARAPTARTLPTAPEPVGALARVEAGAMAAAPGAAVAPVAPGPDRVEQALALVERIERFVRSGRPALALTLRGSLAGRLELQRVAPGAVALRLSSAQPLSSRELDALRRALEARGLAVRSLEASAP